MPKMKEIMGGLWHLSEQDPNFIEILRIKHGKLKIELGSW